MTKKQYSVYLTLEAVEILRTREGFNISRFIDDLLQVEAEITPDEKPNETKMLKLANAKLISKLNLKNVECIELQKRLTAEIQERKVKKEVKQHDYTFG